MTQVVAVDDDGFMRLLPGRVLTGAGMRVRRCGSGAGMLRVDDRRSAQVLLLDVRMPGMSGLGLQHLLRSRGIDLPVVFISGAADLAPAVAAMRNGVAGFIEKPFDSEALAGSRWCGSCRPVRARSACCSCRSRAPAPGVGALFTRSTLSMPVAAQAACLPCKLPAAAGSRGPHQPGAAGTGAA